MDMNLKDVLQKYIKANDLPLTFVARRTGIAQPNLYRWIHEKDFRLSANSIKKIKEFLNGDFIKSVEEVLQDEQG